MNEKRYKDHKEESKEHLPGRFYRAVSNLILYQYANASVYYVFQLAAGRASKEREFNKIEAKKKTAEIISGDSVRFRYISAVSFDIDFPGHEQIFLKLEIDTIALGSRSCLLIASGQCGFIESNFLQKKRFC